MSALVTALSVGSETETVFTAPGINYYAIAPILIIFAAAVVSVLIEAFVPRGGRRPTQLVLVFASIVAALVVVIDLRGTRLITGEGAIAIDGPDPRHAGHPPRGRPARRHAHGRAVDRPAR